MASTEQDFATALAAALPAFAELNAPGDILLRMADTVACALGAERLGADGENAVTRVARFAETTESADELATVWATGTRLATDAAAFRNAAAARFLDYNDTYVAGAIVHPSDMIPAIVALAESRRIGWSRLVDSVGVAYETLCRLAEQANLRQHGFDGSSLTPLATAAGCAWLVALSPAQAANALRIAALDAAMLRAVRAGRLSDWKALASGRGAVKALFAVRMAEAGSEAPPTAFDGREGLFARVSGPLAVANDGVARLPRTILKRFPSQIFTQPMLALASNLHKQLPAKPVSVTINCFRMAVDMLGHRLAPGDTLNRETADHSAAFCVAAMLIRGRLGHDDVDGFLVDPEILALTDKVNLVEEPNATAAFPARLELDLTVHCADETTLTAVSRELKSIGPDDLATKLDDLWPVGRARRWPWTCPADASPFPLVAAAARPAFASPGEPV